MGVSWTARVAPLVSTLCDVDSKSTVLAARLQEFSEGSSIAFEMQEATCVKYAVNVEILQSKFGRGCSFVNFTQTARPRSYKLCFSPFVVSCSHQATSKDRLFMDTSLSTS